MVAVVAGVGLLSGTVIVDAEGAAGTVLLGTMVATVVTQTADVLPLGAVNSARFLRVVGLLAYVAMIVWMVASVLGE